MTLAERRQRIAEFADVKTEPDGFATGGYYQAEPGAFVPDFEEAAWLAAEPTIGEWIEHRRSKRNLLACPIKVSVILNCQEASHPLVRFATSLPTGFS
jgi:hypothetical protein